MSAQIAQTTRGPGTLSLDMWSTCDYLEAMAKMIQLRNVPDALHRKLKDRAAQAGMSLSDFLIAEVRRSAERPTRDDLLARVRRRSPVEVTESPAEVLRMEREAR